MPRKNGPSAQEGEIEGLIKAIEERAREEHSHTVTFGHKELDPLLFGDPDPERKRNRVRWKLAKTLKEEGVRDIRYKAEGYTFILPDEFKLVNSRKQQTEMHGVAASISTATKFGTEFIPPRSFVDIMKAVKAGYSPLLVGPKGCGKSRTLEEVFARLGLEHVRIALGEIREPQDLVGSKEIVSEDGVPVTKYIPGMVTNAAQKGMGVILDELDSVQPTVGLALNKIFEDGSDIIAQTETGAVVVPKHENFRIAATANTWGFGDETGNYAGTFMQNRATWDRLRPKFGMGYDIEIERQLLGKHLPKSVITALYKDDGHETDQGIIVKIRAAIREGNIDDELGMRPLLFFADSFGMFGWHKGMRLFVNEFKTEYRDVVERIVVDLLGEEFRPSDNDYDDSKPDFIPKNMPKLREKGFC